ncbi:Rec8 like protein-domain-containing protein [Cristinia sonorae]|uniref:Rec8 like protein-domain-containing protein n=1 Tax=Cristinia sonorae TaxID=1940300 RepID=A0A8K0XQ10_9AGAR|nr:Rec8 like protein-domain-containing protein [Cristinia sonorae]
MFFTQELLSRRDSGFGLLWLAATLGAKSSFRKLPRRSVTSADIVQLCNLIADPPEPLALRLSSNLMIGAARVYKGTQIKQEIFFTDVTSCSSALKKAVDDMRLPQAVNLQMAQNSVRADAVTVRIDPSAAFAMQFEHLFPEWDKSVERAGFESESDGEYDPINKKKKDKKKDKAKEPALSHTGAARGNLHTLEENYDYLLSASFDASFHDTGFGVVGASSSQAGFGFEEDFLGGMDAENDIAEELARELGAGWGAFNDDRAISVEDAVNLQDVRMADAERIGADFHLGNGSDANAIVNDGYEPEFRMEDGIDPPPVDAAGSPYVARSISPANAQLGQDGLVVEVDIEKPARKPKRVRLLLDSRTELTNEELQRARNLYMKEQAQIRRELNEKRAEKNGEVLLEEMISGVPCGLNAPVLIDFWLENFKLQVQARSGQLVLDTEGEPPTKRRRIVSEAIALGENLPEFTEGGHGAKEFDTGVNDHFEMRGDYNGEHALNEHLTDLESRLRSSEEPGQARQMSRPPSLPGSHLDLLGQAGHEISASQRSAMFPWDNAGGMSSSVAGMPFDMAGSDRFSASLGRGRKGSSLGSRRESPMYPAPNSPANFNFGEPQMDGDGFEFNLADGNSRIIESQQSDVNLNLMNLERHSFDFLEYCKIQLNAFPSQSNSVGFNDIVPVATSTPHVAAAAFYHCLVLATKDLVRLDQPEAFSPLHISVK